MRTGQTETGRVITAAATTMIFVFLTFSFLGQRDVAEFGIGLAAAVALDAFILRTVLVPAAMHIFGNANWWLPRWLDRRLPHLSEMCTRAMSRMRKQHGSMNAAPRRCSSRARWGLLSPVLSLSR